MLWQKYLQNLTIFLLTIIVILYIIQNVVHDKKTSFHKDSFQHNFFSIYMNLFLVKVQQIQFSFWLTGFVVFALNYVYMHYMRTHYGVATAYYIIKINPCYSNYVKMIAILFKLTTLNL